MAEVEGKKQSTTQRGEEAESAAAVVEETVSNAGSVMFKIGVTNATKKIETRESSKVPTECILFSLSQCKNE